MVSSFRFQEGPEGFRRFQDSDGYNVPYQRTVNCKNCKIRKKKV